MQLQAWATGAPYALSNATEKLSGPVVEANSIRLLRAFFQQELVRTLKFSRALDMLTSLLEPAGVIGAEQMEEYTFHDSPPPRKVPVEGPPPILSNRYCHQLAHHQSGLKARCTSPPPPPAPLEGWRWSHEQRLSVPVQHLQPI